MDKEAGLHTHQNVRKLLTLLGPACVIALMIKLLELVKAGVNVFRLNFSHGAYDSKIDVIDFIRQINKTEPYNIAILGDLQAPNCG